MRPSGADYPFVRSLILSGRGPEWGTMYEIDAPTTPNFDYFSRIASTSLSRMTVYFLPFTVTSVPEYLP